MKKRSYTGIGIPLTVLALLTTIMILSGGCGCNQVFTLEDSSVREDIPQIYALPPSQTVEVFHFHPSRQCVSCRELGSLAEETIQTFFHDEIADGRILFEHINADSPEYAALVSRFRASSSSIMIGYTDDSGFHAENQIKLWYKIGDKQAFMQELKDAIEERLAVLSH